MKTRLILVLMPLILLSALVPINVVLPRTHGQLVGKVCVAETVATTCPVAPSPTFTGPVTTPATQLRVAVFIDGSDPLNGFDVTLKTDHTILKPADSDITGSLIGSTTVPTVLVKCIGGVLKQGPTCASTDTIDTIHFAAATLGFINTAPTTGLLFTAIYNITGTTSSAGIPIGFQTGCVNSSVAGGVCVTISNGLSPPVPVPETVQAGNFNNNTPPPFASVSASPTLLTVNAGIPGGTSTITVTANGGFAGLVTFSTVQSAGLSASVNPASVTGSGTATLTVSANAVGTYFVTVLGNYNVVTTGGTSSLSAPVSLMVTVVDFSISASPPVVVFNSGSTGTSTITVVSLNGFAGLVSLSAAINPSADLTASFSPNPVNVLAGGSSTSTATFVSSTPGYYIVPVRGTNSGSIRTKVVIVKVQDFSITANPTAVSFNSGLTGSTTVTLNSLPANPNGFVGTVTLTTSATPATGLTVSCPPSLTLAAGGTVQGTCNFGSSTPGTYAVTVTGTSGSLSHSAMVTVTVTVPDFSISSNPSSLAVNAGSSGVSTISLASLNGFAGTVDLMTSVNPTTGLSATLSVPSVTLTSNGVGSAMLTVSGSTVGTFTVTVTGTSGTLTHSTIVTVNVVDFSIVANPTSIGPLDAGSSGTATITVSPLNGFTGTVTLTATSSPGLTATPSPTTIAGSGTAILTVRAAVPGTYTVTVTGAVGSLSHTTATITVTVVDFTVSASPTTIGPIYPGASGTITITVTGLNGFSRVVALTASPSLGLTATISLGAFAGSGTATLTVSASAAGTYTVTVTGTSGSLSHSTPSMTVTVVDFSISASPSSVTTNVGASGSSVVTVAALNGFSDTMTLTLSPVSGLTASLSRTTIPGSGLSTLTVSAAVPGDYTVTVKGTSGSISHSVTISVKVNPAPSTILGLAPLQFYGIAGVLVVLVAAGVVLAVRRRKPQSV